MRSLALPLLFLLLPLAATTSSAQEPGRKGGDRLQALLTRYRSFRDRLKSNQAEYVTLLCKRRLLQDLVRNLGRHLDALRHDRNPPRKVKSRLQAGGRGGLALQLLEMKVEKAWDDPRVLRRVLGSSYTPTLEQEDARCLFLKRGIELFQEKIERNSRAIKLLQDRVRELHGNLEKLRQEQRKLLARKLEGRKRPAKARPARKPARPGKADDGEGKVADDPDEETQQERLRREEQLRRARNKPGREPASRGRPTPPKVTPARPQPTPPRPSPRQPSPPPGRTTPPRR